MVGNQVPRYSGWKPCSAWFLAPVAMLLETKYRDIADGNVSGGTLSGSRSNSWKPSTAI